MAAKMDGSLYPQTRKKLSDAERAALAQKLDDELDEFMEQMATKKRDREAENPETKKPFDFDEWCKEIEQHPCFMTDKTNINDCLNGKYGDTIAAMQAMKYDEEDSTEDKQITAEKQKAEGNKHFQNKKYRWAIECYTKGIKARCFDRKLNGILYSNRAASNKYLENYRSAIKDAIQARRFDPTNLKATIHAVESLLKLGYGKEAVDLIDQSKKLFALTKETEDGGNVVEGETKLLKDLDNLYKDAEVKYAVQRKQNKQRREEEKADLTEKTKLLAALKERKLNMAPRVPFDHPELFDYARIRVQLAQVSHEHDKVTLDWERNLVWPIMLQYPEVGYTDVITEVSETCGVEELMDSVLAEQAPFDPDHLYKPRSVRYFVTSEYDEFLIEVKKKLTFGQILSAPNYQIRHGLPTILIFSSKHVMEKLQKIGSSDGFDHFIVK